MKLANATKRKHIHAWFLRLVTKREVPALIIYLTAKTWIEVSVLIHSSIISQLWHIVITLYKIFVLLWNDIMYYMLHVQLKRSKEWYMYRQRNLNFFVNAWIKKIHIIIRQNYCIHYRKEVILHTLNSN